MDFTLFLNQHGIKYKIDRNGKIIDEIKGLPNTESSSSMKYIGFMPDTKIFVNDVLINPVGEKIYVVDTQTQFVHGSPFQLKVYYQTEIEHKQSISNSENTVFYINGNISNSIVGNNTTNTFNCQEILSDIESHAAEFPEDCEQLQEIIDLLNQLANDKVQPKRRMFSRFSAIMEKHSWITGSILNFFLDYLK